MDYAVWSDHACSQYGLLLVPRLPAGGDIAPGVCALLREDFVKKIAGTDHASLSIEYDGLFVVEEEHVGTRGRSYLRDPLI